MTARPPEKTIGADLGNMIAGYRDRDVKRAAAGAVSAIERLQRMEDALQAARVMIDRIEGVYGWSTATNARGERLKDEAEYVAAYVAIHKATA